MENQYILCNILVTIGDRNENILWYITIYNLYDKW